MKFVTETQNCATSRYPAFLGCFVGAILAMVPISAHGQCKNWDVSGSRYLYQKRLDRATWITLEQNGKVITGTAHQVADEDADPVTGKVAGTIDGVYFSVQISWANGLTGVYNAKVSPSGKLSGEGYEKATPHILHKWRTEEPIKCAPPPPPPPAPKPIQSSSSVILKPSKNTGKLYDGQKKIEPPPPVPGGSAPVSSSPNPSTPPPMKVPGIVASQAIFPSYASIGFVVLTWDAGPDHPYAEVWFKTNNGAEVFLAEQGKGSRQMPVERGKYYTYILTDASKTLATVNVAGN